MLSVSMLSVSISVVETHRVSSRYSPFRVGSPE